VTASTTPTQGATITLRARILRVGPGGEPGDHGQVPAAGAFIELFRCEIERRRTCLNRPGERIASAFADNRGRALFAVPVQFVIPRRIFVLSVTLDEITVLKLRTLTIVRRPPPATLGDGGGAGIDETEMTVDSISEATVQLLEMEGLETFTDDGVEMLFTAVEKANASANFAGLTQEQAVSSAMTTAENDPTVQQVLEEQRVTPCHGDCNEDGSVTVDEIVTCVGIALGNAAAENCTACDADGSETVTVDEIITSVNNALAGCQ
jgi:hypothetical protein